MTRTAPAIAISALLLSAPQVCAAPASARDIADFTALAAQWLHAIATHDTQALAHILAPEFRDTAWNGRIRTRADMLAHTQGANNAAEQRLSDIEVRRYSSVAVVTGQNTISGMGPTPVILRFTDVFVLHQGRWQAVSAQETLLQPDKR